MTPPAFIRVCVFRMSQNQFAALLGTAQSRVSEWEARGHIPAAMQPLVRVMGRDICAERGMAWSDSWFFEVPADPSPFLEELGAGAVAGGLGLVASATLAAPGGQIP